MPTRTAKKTTGTKRPAAKKAPATRKAPAAKKVAATAPVRRRNVNEGRKELAREKLTGLSDDRVRAEEVATRKRHRMYAGMLKAFNAGLSYDDIAAIVGLSAIRVSQVLAEQRTNGNGR